MTHPHRHRLAGVRSLPLAHYLKGLGVHRLVAEQVDPSARTAWRDGEMWLETALDRDELVRFFLERCSPTPIVSPWNGGSGFYPKDNRDGLDPIRAGSGRRFARYRETIGCADAIVRSLGLQASPKDEEKRDFLQRCRASWPDDAIEWIDAAVILTDEKSVYAPLLGTGGNDGRLEFSSNLMRRWVDLIDPDTDLPRMGVEPMLSLSLFASNNDGLADASIGQFLPASAAGINAWDYVLMIEGALLFACAAVRRFGQARGASSAPFTVFDVSAGYASATRGTGEESRGEVWLPLWSEPTTLPALRALFAEGRATLGRRDARDATEFARAIAGVGVDRGIDAFERIGFHVRNGLSYFATPLGHFDVRRRPQVDLLDVLDPWFDTIRRVARADSAPKSMAGDLHRLDAAILDIARRPTPASFQTLLGAVANLEHAYASRRKLVDDPKVTLRPLRLDAGDWLPALDDGSAELALAVAFTRAWLERTPASRDPVLVGSMIRRVIRTPRGLDFDASDDPRFAWKEPMSLERGLLAILRRISFEARRSGNGSLDLRTRPFAPLSAVSAFVRGETDDTKLRGLIRAVSVLDGPIEFDGENGSPHVRDVPTLYSLLAVAHLRASYDDPPVPLAPEILERAAAGDGYAASTRAVRRLRASGVAVSLDSVPLRGAESVRAAAALAFPIAPRELVRLRHALVRRPESTEISQEQGVTDR